MSEYSLDYNAEDQYMYVPKPRGKSDMKSAMGTSAKEPNSLVNRRYLMSLIMDQYNITESDLDMDPSDIRSKVRDIRIEALVEFGGVTTDA